MDKACRIYYLVPPFALSMNSSERKNGDRQLEKLRSAKRCPVRSPPSAWSDSIIGMMAVTSIAESQSPSAPAPSQAILSRMQDPPSSPETSRFAPPLVRASTICLVGENPTCSVPALYVGIRGSTVIHLRPCMAWVRPPPPPPPTLAPSQRGCEGL